MVLAIKHPFTSPKSDGTDSTLVQPSNWNAVHQITMAANRLIGLSDGPGGAATEMEPSVNISLEAGIVDLSDAIVMPGTGAFTPPSGTTAQRPSVPIAGMIRYNTDLAVNEKFIGSTWRPINQPDDDLTIVDSLTVGGEVTFSGTGEMQVPAGTTAQRSVTPLPAMLRYNSDLGKFEGYNGTDWETFAFAGDVPRVPVRHCPMSGVRNPDGTPAFLGSSGLTLSVVANTVFPFTYTIGKGVGIGGQTDTVVSISASPPSLTFSANAGLRYIWADDAGNIGSSINKPQDPISGVFSFTVDQHSYDIVNGQEYVGTGGAAVKTSRVFIGECTVGASAITNIVCYAYNGFSVLESAIGGAYSTVSKNHNIGTNLIHVDLDFVITVASAGFAVDEVTNGMINPSATDNYYYPAVAPCWNRLAAFYLTMNQPGLQFYSARGAGGRVPTDSGHVKARFTCKRLY